MGEMMGCWQPMDAGHICDAGSEGKEMGFFFIDPYNETEFLGVWDLSHVVWSFELPVLKYKDNFVV